jgi:putative transposase
LGCSGFRRLLPPSSIGYAAKTGICFKAVTGLFVLENSGVWARVADYIHLNPVRAGLVPVERAAQFRWSSFSRFVKNEKFKGLDASSWLETRRLTDSSAGWAEHGHHLQRLTGSPSYSVKTERSELCSGWAIGAENWQQSLALNTKVDENAGKTGERVEPIRMRQIRWQARLDELLAEANRNTAELDSSRKNATWKVAIADELQRSRGVSGWVARGKPTHGQCGDRERVSLAISEKIKLTKHGLTPLREAIARSYLR